MEGSQSLCSRGGSNGLELRYGVLVFVAGEETVGKTASWELV